MAPLIEQLLVEDPPRGVERPGRTRWRDHRWPEKCFSAFPSVHSGGFAFHIALWSNRGAVGLIRVFAVLFYPASSEPAI